MKVRMIITVLMTSLLTGQLSAQETQKRKGRGGLGNVGLDYITGYEYQNLHTLELGLAYGTRGDEMEALLYGNIHVCGEILFKNGSNIYAIKPGVSATCAWLTLAGQFIYFSDFEKSTVALRPEISGSFLGLIDLGIGHNFVLNQSDPLNVSSTVFILRFTYGRTSKPVFN